MGWRAGGGSRDLIAAFGVLKVGGCRENSVLLQGTREKGKRQHSQVTADMRTRKLEDEFFVIRVVGNWNSFSKKILEIPSMEVLKMYLNKALSIL